MMDIWERGNHMRLVGDAEAEGFTREGRASRGGDEEDDAIARSYHSTLLFDNLIQAVCWETNRKGGGCLLPDDQCTKTR